MTLGSSTAAATAPISRITGVTLSAAAAKEKRSRSAGCRAGTSGIDSSCAMVNSIVRAHMHRSDAERLAPRCG